MTDIKFDGDWIRLESTVTKATSTDLMLDAPSRRKTNTAHRRALVHDFDDGLTLNWDSDYPGGVSVRSCREIGGHNRNDWLVVRSRVAQFFGTDIMLDGGNGRRGAGAPTSANPHRRALVHGLNDQLVLNYNGDYTGGVVVNGRVAMPHGATVGSMDVGATLASLTNQVSTLAAQLNQASTKITQLTARVEALESGVTP